MSRHVIEGKVIPYYNYCMICKKKVELVDHGMPISGSDYRCAECGAESALEEYDEVGVVSRGDEIKKAVDKLLRELAGKDVKIIILTENDVKDFEKEFRL